MHHLQATCGTLGLSTATVKLIAPDGEERIACSVGTGPVDAAYKAVDQIIQVSCCRDLGLSCIGTRYLTRWYRSILFLVMTLVVSGEHVVSYRHYKATKTQCLQGFASNLSPPVEFHEEGYSGSMKWHTCMY
jgi:hypothetical protein